MLKVSGNCQQYTVDYGNWQYNAKCNSHSSVSHESTAQYSTAGFVVPLDTGHFGDNFTGQMTQPTVS